MVVSGISAIQCTTGGDKRESEGGGPPGASFYTTDDRIAALRGSTRGTGLDAGRGLPGALAAMSKRGGTTEASHTRLPQPFPNTDQVRRGEIAIAHRRSR